MTQQEALDILKSGANVFLTGEPGSGKTHTINEYIGYLHDHGISPAITASTGIAATHINGMTIHSWSGIGIQKVFSEDDVAAIAGRKKIASRIAKNRILIIDEISMLDAQTLDAVETVCRAVKQSGLPWGGMQVVFVGDFFQLPPVSRAGDPPRQFAYQSNAWQDARPVVCYLSEQHRQDDATFLSILSSIRTGDIVEEIHHVLSQKVRAPKGSGEHTRIYSHNMNVDRVNDDRLRALDGKERTFAMGSRGPEDLVKQLKKGCLSPELLRLKVGAKVMFTKNDTEHQFVNGTIGTVEGFSKEDGSPIVRTERGYAVEVAQEEWSIVDGERTLAKIFQLPLRLAWAITVHKSQGMTLDSAIMDLSDAFEYGQGYVALSRVRALDGLHLIGYNARALEVHPDVLEADVAFRQQSLAAQQEFLAMSDADKLQSQKAFIVRCGGATQKGEKGKKVKKHKDLSARRTGDKENTRDKTVALWREGKDAKEIARLRGLAEGTIVAHLEESYMNGSMDIGELRRLASPRLVQALPQIEAAFKELGMAKLSPVFEKLKGEYSYDDLRLARILLSATPQ